MQLIVVEVHKVGGSKLIIVTVLTTTHQIDELLILLMVKITLFDSGG